MVGGRSTTARTERVFRMEFPERPGALLDFLEKLGNKWNITLFHYRNLGSAFGKVLVGVQDSSKNKELLKRYLKRTGYTFTEETSNIAYKHFLE